jgi:Zn-finger nucleic acid-binding protein
MKCPICTVDLVMADRQGVEIDYCPKCRGVWLDRGEIDKIIERSAALEAKATQPAPQPTPQPSPQPAGFAAPQPAYAPPQQGYAPPPQPGWVQPQGHWKRDDDDDDRYRKHGHYHGKKRKGFLSDLLDFD